MEQEHHEELLTELLNPDLEQTRKAEILTELRGDYSSVVTDFSTLTAEKEKLTADRADLILQNSKLFREAGFKQDPAHKEGQQKEFSETVTIEELEKGVKV